MSDRVSLRRGAEPAPDARTPEAVSAAIEHQHRVSFFRRRYGAGPAHLVSLLLCFAVSGYAVWRWLEQPTPTTVRLLVWFAGAVIGHDFVLFPIYTAIDRRFQWATRSGRSRSARAVPVVNHVRVPLLFSGLLLLLWFPLIFNKPEPAYLSATGLSTSPYLMRWLLVSAALFVASALIFLVRYLVRASPSGAGSPRSDADANSATPSANSTAADQRRS